MDPTNRKPVPLSWKLRLPNGKTMTAGEYWSKLQGLEDQLNKQGYSFWPGIGPKEIVQGTPTPTALLHLQARTLSLAYVPGARFQPLPPAQAEQSQKNVIVIPPEQLANLSAVRGAALPLQVKKSFNHAFGDPNDLSVFLNGQMELDGTTSSTSLDAEADAGGSIFGHSFDLMKISGKLNSPRNGPLNVNVNASMLGFNVYDQNQNVNSSFTKSDSVSKTLDVTVVKIHFTLLLIPMSVKLGVQGAAGFSYTVTVKPVQASGEVKPFIRTSAYGEVGVDVDVAAAGVRGSLTILNVDGDLQGNLAVVPDTKNGANYSYNAEYCQNIDTLGGSLEAFVTVGICPFCLEDTHNIHTFPGIKSSGCLFQESKTLPVFQPMSRTGVSKRGDTKAAPIFGRQPACAGSGL
jgi:hypothetical protein